MLSFKVITSSISSQGWSKNILDTIISISFYFAVLLKVRNKRMTISNIIVNSINVCAALNIYYY